MNNDWIKSYVIQILPAISTVVYVLGFAYNIIYYNEFGINILSYITFSEVLVSSLIPIIFIVLVNMLGVAGGLLYYPGIRFMKRKLKKVIDLHKIKNNIKVVARKCKIQQKTNIITFAFSYSIMSTLLCLVIPCLIYMDVIDVGNYKYFILALASVAYSSCIIIYIIGLKKMRFDIVKKCINTYILCVNFICLIIIVVSVAYYNAEKDKTRNEENAFEIITEDGINFNNDKYNYINDCSHALFLYERSSKETIVIPINRISSIRYKRCNTAFYHKVINDIDILYNIH